MLNSRHNVSIIDGKICIAVTTSMQDEPKLITNHYPTSIRAKDCAYYFRCDDAANRDELLCKLEVFEHFSGHYRLKNNINSFGPTHADIDLLNYGKTMPISTTIADYPKPRGKQVEYENGCWHKCTAKG